jgi:hypothetical protein
LLACSNKTYGRHGLESSRIGLYLALCRDGLETSRVIFLAFNGV